jgi:hypothetical protein
MEDWGSKVIRTILIICAGLFVFWYVLPQVTLRMSRSAERKRTYEWGLKRVESAGGWNVLEQACLTLSSNVIAKYNIPVFNFYWFGGDTNSLPQALQKLGPRAIRLEANKVGVPIMKVQLAGVHRTGYYDAPYYGIWIVCTNLPDYVPIIESHEHGMRGLVTRKGNLVFEVR